MGPLSSFALWFVVHGPFGTLAVLYSPLLLRFYGLLSDPINYILHVQTTLPSALSSRVLRVQDRIIPDTNFDRRACSERSPS